jgi:hypothetical protein
MQHVEILFHVRHDPGVRPFRYEKEGDRPSAMTSGGRREANSCNIYYMAVLCISSTGVRYVVL